MRFLLLFPLSLFLMAGETKSPDCFLNYLKYRFRFEENRIEQTRKHLLSALESKDCKINERDKTGHTPLHYAAKFAPADILKQLLDHGADVNAQRRWGGSPLHDAVNAGNAENAAVLLERKAAVDSPREDKMTPLLLAAKLGHADIIALLLRFKANVRATIDKHGGASAVHIAAQRGNSQALEVLLKKQPTLVNARTEKLGKTPLFLAIENGERETVEVLISYGADLNMTTSRGRHPLEEAIVEGRQGLVELLLASGAKYNGRRKVPQGCKTARERLTHCDWVRSTCKKARDTVEVNCIVDQRQLDSQVKKLASLCEHTSAPIEGSLALRCAFTQSTDTAL